MNTPPSHLFPAEFAKRAKAFGEAAGLQVEVLDEKALEKAGYGGIIGVGKGSSRPPRLVRLTHRSGKRRRPKKVALVGKGITFDTGGISIKPAAVDAPHDLRHGRGRRGDRDRGHGRATASCPST